MNIRGGQQIHIYKFMHVCIKSAQKITNGDRNSMLGKISLKGKNQQDFKTRSFTYRREKSRNTTWVKKITETCQKKYPPLTLFEHKFFSDDNISTVLMNI